MASLVHRIAMRRRVLTVFVLLLLAATVWAGTPGSFRGVLVESPNGSKRAGWIFLKGRNGMLRSVEITKAHVTYEDAVPQKERLAKPEQALLPGVEVRVTAEQGSDGEWHATDIEILSKDHDDPVPISADVSVT